MPDSCDSCPCSATPVVDGWCWGCPQNDLNRRLENVMEDTIEEGYRFVVCVDIEADDLKQAYARLHKVMSYAELETWFEGWESTDEAFHGAEELDGQDIQEARMAFFPELAGKEPKKCQCGGQLVHMGLDMPDGRVIEGDVCKGCGSSLKPAPKAHSLTGQSVDVDGRVDVEDGIAYVGKAYERTDGTWQCLADVQGMLCLVEVKISMRTKTDE